MPGKLKRTLPTPVLAVSVTEAAKAMGLSRGSIYQLAKDGKLPIRKVGTRSLVLVTDMQAALEKLPITVSEYMIV